MLVLGGKDGAHVPAPPVPYVQARGRHGRARLRLADMPTFSAMLVAIVGSAVSCPPVDHPATIVTAFLR